jgi:hypothetical protein
MKEEHSMFILLHSLKRRVVFLVGILLLLIFAGSATAVASDSTDQVGVPLRHTPSGHAWLQWDPQTKDLKVTIDLTGLAANSTHPAHIHLGVCTSNGPIKYMLNNVDANAAGDATSTTVIHNVEKGIPAHGWYINVHNGPRLQPADQFIPLACGEINHSNTSSSQVQTVRIALGATNADDQSASGSARLTLKDEVLTVVVTVHRLVPGSRHAEHIHAGSCQQQLPGTIVYMLKDLAADKDGNATATTVIKDGEHIPTSGWYINVHRTTDLSNQTGFDPIDCGDVVKSEIGLG